MHRCVGVRRDKIEILINKEYRARKRQLNIHLRNDTFLAKTLLTAGQCSLKTTELTGPNALKLGLTRSFLGAGQAFMQKHTIPKQQTRA
ncbi:hypothetical protein L596_011436 [Steinernema carpocapsae]|uniref:Uncharacterized protein n=1 Tax=Steinernema carpocapsae TaxID=34508 RepID=A0A4U5NUS8_STECR|nr:hypothetical protein L596_011436 [Steinernema carpocapsae]